MPTSLSAACPLDGLLAADHPRRRGLDSDAADRALSGLAPPVGHVTAFYTGANAQAVESAVTTPLEQAINGVEGMTYMTSSSTNSGFATITVTFDVDRDQDLAAVDVQNRVNQALGRMPAEVRQNGITVQGVDRVHRRARLLLQGQPLLDLFISNYIDLYIRDAIKRVPGVGDVIIFGERKFAMRLWLDPDQARGAQHHRGRRAECPARAERAGRRRRARRSPAPAEQTYTISVRADGPTVRSRRVRERRRQDRERRRPGPRQGRRPRRARRRDYSSNLRFLELEAAGMGITLLPTANALDVYQGVVEAMARLEPNFPPGLEWRLAFDNVSVVRDRSSRC